ncbi:MAG: rhodanese-like domain-containing protein, partial [Thermofilaceae archaeon]
YDLKEVSVEEAYGELEVETPPPDSIIVDLRSSSSRRVWSIPGSISMDFDQLIEGAAGLDPAKKYVLVCDEGALSLEAAYILRKLGFQAYSLRGGAKRLRRMLTKS